MKKAYFIYILLVVALPINSCKKHNDGINISATASTKTDKNNATTECKNVEVLEHPPVTILSSNKQRAQKDAEATIRASYPCPSCSGCPKGESCKSKSVTWDLKCTAVTGGWKFTFRNIVVKCECQ
ncbi:MAG: hypothetical protein JWQ54_2184 [Mucilaginibacter sp.]|nr:hypothetical protein [Mucilaginibacter sp.]